MPRAFSHSYSLRVNFREMPSNFITPSEVFTSISLAGWSVTIALSLANLFVCVRESVSEYVKKETKSMRVLTFLAYLCHVAYSPQFSLYYPWVYWDALWNLDRLVHCLCHHLPVLVYSIVLQAWIRNYLICLIYEICLPNFFWKSSGKSFWSGSGVKPWPSNFSCPVFQRFQSIFGFASVGPSRTGDVGEICVGCDPTIDICFFTRHLRNFFLKSGVRFSSRSFADRLLLKTGCCGCCCSSGLGGVIKAIAVDSKNNNGNIQWIGS